MRLQNLSNLFFFLVFISMTVVQSCTEKQDIDVTPLPKTNFWTTSFDRSNLLSASSVEAGKGRRVTIVHQGRYPNPVSKH
jgi:hypothetical protein